MELPEDELNELAAILDSGALTPLRDRFDQPRRVRQELSRYSPRIYLFPFGLHPNPTYPVQVFVNGIGVWMEHEAVLARIGTRHPLTVVVLDRPLGISEVVQATYQAVPEIGR